MEEKTWIEHFAAIGAVITPIFVLILSVIGWRIKSSFERKIDLENRLRDDRVEIYNQILEPFIIALMSDAAWAQDKRYKNKDKIKFASSTMLRL